MVEQPRFAFACVLVGLFLAGCVPNFASRIEYKPYHDPFDTTRALDFAQVTADQAKFLQQILDRSTPGGRSDDEASYSPDYLPYGTIALEGKEGNREGSCVCFRRRIECGKTDEYEIGQRDLDAYRNLMGRIDSEARARAGASDRTSESPVQPVVPVE
ncbi:MAG TPA: hypothetical protein VN931_11885 [Fibrobacteria bacterium]|nr:hypothetical protein [Fibrobacteria bacterium]